MDKVIASTYEIIEKIGAGGTGVVYLARHQRLDKKVVLKADIRKITTKPEILRREVDILKNLSHTYIHHLNDYIVEGDTVYTVMDYVEGESFEEKLKRGEVFTQAQVVKWASQLLQALSYMHSRPPHGILHADIKPSNIMLTPEGDIKLIDFNIALMLGENGAVAVGRSYGYASPEHFGLNYTGSGITQNSSTMDSMAKFDSTMHLDDSSDSASSGKPRKKVVLDKRSDIYSLGATLYHILTGRKPAPSALEVQPITAQEASPAVAAIIMRAMAPDADLRYQTPDEMLYDFDHLWENDPRAVKLKHRRKTAAIVLAAVFAAGAFSAFTGLRQISQTQKSYALAGYSETALKNGDRAQAIEYALQALPNENSIFNPPYTPQAQRALADALGVYDLSDGFKAAGTVSQKSETMKLALSPDGKSAAAACAGEVTVFDTETGKTLAELPKAASALADIVFADSDTLTYAAEAGAAAYSISGNTTKWTAAPAEKLAVSADGKTVAALAKDSSKAVIYDIDGEQKGTVDMGGKTISTAANDGFADPGDVMFKLNGAGTLLAVSFSNGALELFDTTGGNNGFEIFDASDYTHFEGGFSGRYFAFSATGSSGSLFAVIDAVAGEQTGGFELSNRIGVNTDESGIYISNETTVVRIDPVTGDQTELAYTNSDVAAFAHTQDFTLVLTADNAYSFFDKTAVLMSRTEGGDVKNGYAALAGGCALIGGLDTPDIKILKLENHSDAQVFSYDPAYAHDEARVNADGTTVMLFNYKGFRLCSMDGAVIKDAALPDAEQVYDQQYRRDADGSRLEVIYNDGTVRTYSGDTGELVSETKGSAPDKAITDVFYTDRLKIEAPLHGSPTVYDVKSGKELCQLTQDAYLTYVTQVGEYVITEYITEDGSRYGLVLDEDCQAVAYMPNLCDVDGDTLYFDYHSGNMRTAPLYSINQLIDMAKGK